MMNRTLVAVVLLLASLQAYECLDLFGMFKEKSEQDKALEQFKKREEYSWRVVSDYNRAVRKIAQMPPQAEPGVGPEELLLNAALVSLLDEQLASGRSSQERAWKLATYLADYLRHSCAVFQKQVGAVLTLGMPDEPSKPLLEARQQLDICGRVAVTQFDRANDEMERKAQQYEPAPTDEGAGGTDMLGVVAVDFGATALSDMLGVE